MSEETTTKTSNDGDSKSLALIPIEETEVNFYGDTISAALVEINNDSQQAKVYIPVRPICDYLGLSWAGQRERIYRDDVLAPTVRSVRVTRTEAGGRRDTLCLPLEKIPGWLFTIDTSRIKPELREKVLRYKRECFDILWETFKNRTNLVMATAATTTITSSRSSSSVDLAQQVDPLVFQLAKQIENLSGLVMFLHEHLEMMMQTNGQVSEISERLNQALQLLESLTEQQEQLTEQQQQLTNQQQELANQQEQLADQQEHLAHRQEHTESDLARIDERTNQLTPAHKRQIKDMVDTMVRQTRTLATPLTYIIIYGRLKRRFNVAKYDEIVDERFDEVMAYLREELRRATNGEAPQQGTLF